MFDEKGRAITASVPEAVAQTMGFRPQRMAALSGEHRTMKNLLKHYGDSRNELYDRFALARTQEDRQKVLKDAQKFNLETAKYRGFIIPISGKSLKESYLRRARPEKKQMFFGRLSEANG